MGWNTYTWPLHVTWASSKNGGWILKASTERRGEREREREREREGKKKKKEKKKKKKMKEEEEEEEKEEGWVGSCILFMASSQKSHSLTLAVPHWMGQAQGPDS